MQKFLSFLFVLVFALFIAGCRNDASDGNIQVSNEYVFSDVVKINLVNGHNGYSTTITDKTDIENIIAFVGGTVGQRLGSGKGYYEGTYSVTFQYDNGEEFTLIYGDDDVFYMGKGEDGYPIRYRLINITISDDVVPTFSLYDKSGTVWKDANK